MSGRRNNGTTTDALLHKVLRKFRNKSIPNFLIKIRVPYVFYKKLETGAREAKNLRN